MPPAIKKKEFNPAVVQAMQEPITATVFKVFGNSQNPVTLPLKEGQVASGQGMSRDDIMKLATTDLIKQVSAQAGNGDGSGVYAVHLVDPNGASDRFEMVWPANIAPMGSSAWQAPAAPGQSYSAWPPQQPYPAQGFGYAPQNPYQHTQAMPPWPGQPYPAQAQAWPPPHYNPYTAQPPWAWSTPPQVGAANETQQLRDTIAASERARLEDKYLAERHAMETRHAQELAQLRDEIRRSGESKPSGPSSELVAMQATIARLENDLRASRDSADRLRDENARRQELQAMQQGLEGKIAQIAQSVQTLAAAPKSDPMIPLIQEQARQSAETAKAIAASSKETTELMLRVMLNPAQAMEMAKGMSQKPDELIKSFEGVMSMYQNAFAMMQQAAGGGGNPIAETITAGMQQIGDAVKQIFKSKGVEASAQAQVADAQARALQAQAQVIAINNGRPGFAAPPPIVQLPGAPASGEIVTPAQPTTAASAQPTADGASVPSAEDLKLFGPEMAEQIVKFRLHVAGQLIDLKTNQPVPQPTPEEAAEIVQQAAGMATQLVQSRNLRLAEAIPAFAWYNPKDMARLTAALLPDAPQAFVDALTQKLVQELTGEDPEDEDEDDDDEPEPIAATPNA